MTYNRKEYKRQARKILFGHYGIYVLICLVAAMLGITYTNSYTSLRKEVAKITLQENNVENQQMDWQLNNILESAIENKGQGKVEKNVAQLLKLQKKQKPIYITKHIQIGHNNGVLAKIRNDVVSGAFLLTLLSALTVVLGSSSAATIVLVLLAFVIVAFVWVFFINVYKVICARMFLEGRLYQKVPVQRFTFLFYVKKWWNASLTMLLREIYYNLWLLTFIGGIVKHFSYFAVPYIVAENPGMPAKKVIRLSRRMMKGHKWECFKLYFSFIGWRVLDVMTFGLSGIFYSNPYVETAYCEYYVYIRELAKKNQIEDADLLQDRYLFELPEMEVLTKEYGTLEQYESVSVEEKKSFFSMLSNTFGLYIFAEKHENETALMEQKRKYQSVKQIFEYKVYPTRLLPFTTKEKRSILEFVRYNRKYSVWTVILLFVLFSFVGWTWEVSLHLIEDGVFVNRGALHGPYLPVYGTGGIIILLALYKLREKPLLEFGAAVLLCGVIEYVSGYMLEVMHHGQKWWNYSGDFFNIDGRVCAEGLFVFGIGGMLVVYIVAPLLDNLLSKVKPSVLVSVSVALMLIMSVDVVYSSVRPNTGKGITSFNSQNKQAVICVMDEYGKQVKQC